MVCADESLVCTEKDCRPSQAITDLESQHFILQTQSVWLILTQCSAAISYAFSHSLSLIIPWLISLPLSNHNVGASGWQEVKLQCSESIVTLHPTLATALAHRLGWTSESLILSHIILDITKPTHSIHATSPRLCYFWTSSLHNCPSSIPIESRSSQNLAQTTSLTTIITTTPAPNTTGG